MTRAIRITFFAVACLFLLSMAEYLEADSAQVPKRSVRLNNYNNWHLDDKYFWELDKKLEILARRDNICFSEHWERANKVEGWKKINPQTLKALNPKAKVYRVYDLCCKNNWDTDWDIRDDKSRMQTPLSRATIDANNWWLRDAGGRIIKENDKTWFLDVGKPGFKEAFLKNVLDRNAGKGFDGFVFDYWYPYFYGALQGRSRPEAYPTDEEWFTKAWKPFITYLTDGLHKAGYRIIGNCVGEYQTTNPREIWQRSKVDGAIYEQWSVDWLNNSGKWLPGSLIEKRINALYKDPLEVWTADLGLQSSDPEYERKQTVGLAMYYIAIPVSQEKRSYHHMKDGNVYWENIWDFYIGLPAEPPVKLPNKYFWSRKYTQGIVLLNYESAKSVTYSLKGEYRNSAGKTISGDVTLSPHTAMILADI